MTSKTKYFGYWDREQFFVRFSDAGENRDLDEHVCFYKLKYCDAYVPVSEICRDDWPWEGKERHHQYMISKRNHCIGEVQDGSCTHRPGWVWEGIIWALNPGTNLPHLVCPAGDYYSNEKLLIRDPKDKGFDETKRFMVRCSYCQTAIPKQHGIRHCEAADCMAKAIADYNRFFGIRG